MEEVKNFFKFSFDFVGVLNRRGFWIPILISTALQILFWCLISLGTLFQLLAIGFSLVLFIPTLSAVVRRLHDTDRSGLYALWLLFPLVGIVIITIYTLEKTKYII